MERIYTGVMDKKLPKFETKKSLGQHFLNNARVPELMADAGNVKGGDIVLEIGPGTGALTRELLKRGASVIAFEADIRAVESLKETFSAEIMAQNTRPDLVQRGLTVVHGDVREIDLKALGLRPSAFKIVANIPYYLSGMLFRLFLESDIQPTDLVFLVQREVAERIARDKKESLLSLSIKVFGEPKYVKTIGKGNFTPPPKIDSAIIAITNISKKRLDAMEITTLDAVQGASEVRETNTLSFSKTLSAGQKVYRFRRKGDQAVDNPTVRGANERSNEEMRQRRDFHQKQFFRILHEGFKSKRKQLLGNLSGMLPRETLTHIFSTCKLPLDVRGEDVPLNKWLELCKEISPQFVEKKSS